MEQGTIFILLPEQLKTIEIWKKQVEAKVKKDFPPDILEPDKPYFGAIAGGMTYSFTPTGLGTIIKVKYGNEELDLTDYDNW